MREAEPLVPWYSGRYLWPWNSPRSGAWAVGCTMYCFFVPLQAIRALRFMVIIPKGMVESGIWRRVSL